MVTTVTMVTLVTIYNGYNGYNGYNWGVTFSQVVWLIGCGLVSASF